MGLFFQDTASIIDHRSSTLHLIIFLFSQFLTRLDPYRVNTIFALVLPQTVPILRVRSGMVPWNYSGPNLYRFGGVS